MCEWIPKAKELAARGYRVLAFDFPGFGGSASGHDPLAASVEEAVKQLRAEGASKIVLIGASMGGTASAVAAATIDPPVTALITISSPVNFSGADAASAVKKLSIPMLFVAGSGDAAFARAAQDLKSANQTASIYIAEGSTAHGAWLIYPGGGHAGAIEAVDNFLNVKAPA